jgi:PQQ-dependent dehydrogenase (s-GDH family)
MRRIDVVGVALVVVIGGIGCSEGKGAGAPEELAPAVSLGKHPPPRDAGGTAAFVFREVTSGLYAPHEITWGPDGYLWVTERVGRRVLRVNPSNGARIAALTIADAHQSAAQDGLMGMALHPQLLTGSGNDYVYVAYTYDANPGRALDRRTKLRRYTFDAETASLTSPVDLIDRLPASEDHNSGRLVFGPDAKLYYTIGDQGNNQFARACLPIRAQELPSADAVRRHDWTSYQGKILRLELDGSIPADNPLIDDVQSHIYSYGHRNAQGIAFGPHGILYANEHGPKTDDELNRIEAGRNYGWPHVAGYRDDQAYVYGNWSASSPTPCEELTFSDYVIPESVPTQRERDWRDRNFMPPLATFFTVPNDHDFTDPACEGAEYQCWPTIAPSSLDVYADRPRGVPGWDNSLLMTSLKKGAVLRIRLSHDGRRVVGEAVTEFKTTNRYRDIAISPDGRKFYVLTDSENLTQAPGGGYTAALENRGAILEFTYSDIY